MGAVVAIIAIALRIRNNFFHRQLRKLLTSLQQLKDDYRQKEKILKQREACYDMSSDQVHSDTRINVLNLDEDTVERFANRILELQRLTGENRTEQNRIHEMANDS